MSSLDSFIQSNAASWSEKLGSEEWYLVAVAALTSGNQYANAAGVLFEHLTRLPVNNTPEKRQIILKRLREALVKLFSFIGIPKSLEGMFSLAYKLGQNDENATFVRSGWTPAQTRERGMNLNNRIYQGEADKYFELLSSHPDFDFILRDIVYGLCLSDTSILSDLETESLVVASLIIQNTKQEVDWHKKGLKRLGMENEMVDALTNVVPEMAEFMKDASA